MGTDDEAMSGFGKGFGGIVAVVSLSVPTPCGLTAVPSGSASADCLLRKHGRRRGSLFFDCAGHIVDVAFKQSNAGPTTDRAQ